MAIQLSSLRVDASFDASGYARGMAQKVSADEAGIRSSERLGAALAREDVVAQNTGGVIGRLSARHIDGYGSAVRHAAAIQQLANAMDRGGVTSERAAAIVAGLNRQYGMTANAADLASRGHVQLAAVVDQVNARFGAADSASTRMVAGMSSVNDASRRMITGMSAAGAANDNFAAKGGLARFELINLGRQIQDIGVSLASGQSPFTVLAQQGTQVADIFVSSRGGVKGFFDQIMAGAAAVLTPWRAVALGIGAVAVAAVGLYALLRERAPTAEQALKTHADLLGVVKDSYRDAAKQAGEFYNQSKAITQLQLQQNMTALQSRTQALSGVPTYVAPAGEVFGATRFRELNQAIEQLAASARGWQDVQQFRDAIAAIGVAANETNPQLAQQAARILENTKELGDLALASQKAEAALRLLTGTASEGDRKLLGLSTTNTINAYEQLIQRTRDRIDELKLEAETAGQASSAVQGLRLQHEAELAARKAGVPVNQQAIDQLKEELDLASRRAALANIRADIEFQRGTAFLSAQDAQIAERLRGIFGNDIPAALASSEAALMRLNQSLSALKRQAESKKSANSSEEQEQEKVRELYPRSEAA